ncbi:uncharacterized protein C2845_PM16G21710 [Panicum miliaceum]|uniref:Uncharacterized protein n=1 Tax=Panicum miliaceum TaxID=4540 RepID=A0A3L6PXC7_PANMI|nr:uncharacterized protein C2845_PM16G21710 [Panicum miliaceum]
MAPASSSFAGAACFVLLLVLAGASVSHGSFLGRRVLSDEQATGIVALWRRSLADAPPPPNNFLVLASQRTRRSDPFANLTAYTGGWNISDEHYWGSVAYTAVPLFVLAVVWFVGFGAVLLIISCCCCFCGSKDGAYSPCCYFTSLAFLAILTIATISIKTVDYVVGQGDLTVDNLRNFAGSLAAAKNITIDQIFLPADVQQKIDIVEEKLNSSANEFSTRLLENSIKIKKVVNHMEHELMATAAVMGGLAVFGFLLSVLGLRFLVSILVILAWFNLTVILMTSGVFLLLHNVVGDTCVAMDDWVTHPQAHTALDDILPCVDVATANLSLYRSQEVTAQLVALVNNVVVNISNREFPAGLLPLNFNQSGPLMPVLCNPFNPDMSPRACVPGEVDFKSAAREWKRFECQTTGPPGSEVCVTPGRLTPAAYGQMTAATSVSQGLFEYGPFLVQLQDCSFVRETFLSISDNNCPGLERYSRHVYVGLIIISGGVMLSVVFWMVHTRQRRRRAMAKQL